MKKIIKKKRGERGGAFTVDQICKALIESKGLITLAAKRLGCTYQTICNYRKKYPKVDETVNESLVGIIDMAESKLWQLIQRGELGAITFFLRTRGKARGYIDSKELTGPNGTPLLNPEEKVSKDIELEKKRAFILAFLSSLENQIENKNGSTAIEVIEPIRIEPSTNGHSQHIDF